MATEHVDVLIIGAGLSGIGAAYHLHKQCPKKSYLILEGREDLDYSGKRVVVIGSGATAMTLIPAMAKDVEHIVMLQRSPTYVISRPDTDVIANSLRKVLCCD